MHKEDPLVFEVMAHDSYCHGDALQFSPVDTHELISEVNF